MAKAWATGVGVARYFTAYDADALRQNVTEHSAQLVDNAISILSFPRQMSEIDDTARFERALESGWNLRLEKGKEYVVNNLHIDKSNFSLFGNGAKLSTSSPTASSIFIDHGCSNILIEEIVFQGLADGTNDNPAAVNILSNGTSAQRGTSASNIEISYCTFLGGYVFSVIATGTTGLEIHHCKGTGNFYVPSASAGGYFILTQTCYDVDIHHNEFVAKANDRHAVYISCAGDITGDQANENVQIHHNRFDWRLAGGSTGFETCVTARTTRGLFINNNFINGGYGGIGISSSHGSLINADIHDNQIINIHSNLSYDRFCISVSRGDKATVYRSKSVKIHNNQLSSISNRVHGIVVTDVDGFEIQNNDTNVMGSGSFGLEIVDSTDGIIGGNRLQGNATARTGLMYAGNVSSDIIVTPNKITNFTYREEVLGASADLVNSTHQYTRSFSVTSSGSGSISVSNDIDLIVDTVTSTFYGCDIKFKKVYKPKQGDASIVISSGSISRMQNRSANALDNVLSLNLFDSSSTALPLATNAASFRISINT
ncbi:hypothetical protein BJP51_32185 [Paenibacillus odorifer]|uniref:Right handed beta helix domain-containing protein n=1 Tax=Paenibacillus odorifer TaxID=189426 RepID=A0A1R0WTU8_9BACL|nr:hypothetical protein BJP51_32185 [Paenibacillus odorifer]